ncbi:MAG: DUF3179 domain-containing protein [Chloroflexi bacterium]|nr:DUF3179 domain-containing protein [Chloroflexota bacterium]
MDRRRLLALASATGLIVACGETTPRESGSTPNAETSTAEQPPFTAVIPPHTSVAGAASRMRLPPQVLAAREATLVAATPADMRRADELRGMRWTTNFQIASVPLSRLQTNDLERFRAYPIDVPRFDEIDVANAFLDPREPVIQFTVGQTARAYPLRFLVWHEIVNDEVEGRPILVTYDPRTNAARVVERRLLGAAMRFRAADALDRGGRLLWDSLTQSWWRQFTGEAIVGDLTGLQLRPRPSLLVSYAAFRKAFPQGRVLDSRSRPERDDSADYGATNYPGYERHSDPPLSVNGTPDRRLPPTARVLALEVGGEAAAFAFDHLASERAINVEVGGQPVVALWSPGVLSVLDAPRIADSRDVGMAAAHGREVRDRVLTFTFADGVVRDRETGSVWSLSGRALSGALAGAQLPPLVHNAPFWFAWAAHYPATRLVTNPT